MGKVSYRIYRVSGDGWALGVVYLIVLFLIDFQMISVRIMLFIPVEKLRFIAAASV